MALRDNFYNFTLYIGRIKNKTVDRRNGYNIYDGLFLIDGIRGNVQREACLVACVIQGYFMSVHFNSGNGPAPFDRVISGITHDLPLMDMLRGTGFSREGTLEGRQQNIDDAFRWLGNQQPQTSRTIAVETSLYDLPRGQPIRDLMEGQIVEVLETVDAAWIKAAVEGVTGFVMAAMLRPNDPTPLQG
jgi:hypothetical protein